MGDYSDQISPKIIRTMREWQGNENLDDIHTSLLADMVTFASLPICMGVLDNPHDLIVQLTEITKAAFNLGYAKGRSE